MGVRTNLLAITLTGAEVTALQTNGQDGIGNVELAAQKVADAIATIQVIVNNIPAGTNKTTLNSAITSLT